MIGSWSGAAGGAWRDNDLIFATKQGEPLERDNLRCNFGGVVANLGLPTSSPH